VPQGFGGLVALGAGCAEIFSWESLTLWLSGKQQARVSRQRDDNFPLGELARIYVQEIWRKMQLPIVRTDNRD